MPETFEFESRSHCSAAIEPELTQHNDQRNSRQVSSYVRIPIVSGSTPLKPVSVKSNTRIEESAERLSAEMLPENRFCDMPTNLSLGIEARAAGTVPDRALLLKYRYSSDVRNLIVSGSPPTSPFASRYNLVTCPFVHLTPNQGEFVALAGTFVGAFDGAFVGAFGGVHEGALLGPNVDGALLGAYVSPALVGANVDGAADGTPVGTLVGIQLGELLGGGGTYGDGAAVGTFPQMGLDSNPQLVRMAHELPPVD